MSRLTLGFALLIAWMLMWGSASPGTIIGGMIVISLMYAIFPSSRRSLPTYNAHPLAAVKLGVFFLRQLVVSNALLSMQLLRRTPQVRAVVVDVPMHTNSASVLNAVCNLCAMSPGTMVVGVDLEPPVVRAHILVFGGQTSHDEAVEVVYTLERYSVAAFGTDEDRAHYDDAVANGIPAVEVVP